MIKYSLENIKVVGESCGDNRIVWVTGNNESGEEIELGLINYDTILDIDGCTINGLELNDIFDHDLIEQDYDQEVCVYSVENGVIVEDFEGLRSIAYK